MYFIVILRAILQKEGIEKMIGKNLLNLIQAQNLLTKQEWV